MFIATKKENAAWPGTTNHRFKYQRSHKKNLSLLQKHHYFRDALIEKQPLHCKSRKFCQNLCKICVNSFIKILHTFLKKTMLLDFLGKRQQQPLHYDTAIATKIAKWGLHRDHNVCIYTEPWRSPCVSYFSSLIARTFSIQWQGEALMQY